MENRRKLSVTGIILLVLPLLALWKGGMDLRATWVLVVITSACALWECFQDRERELPRRLTTLGIAFVAWTALSFLTSSTQTWGFDEVVRDAALMLLFWIAARTSDYDQKNMLRWILLVACIAAIVGLVIYALEPGRRLVGTFFDLSAHEEWPNAFASLLLLTWPLSFFVLKRKWGVLMSGMLIGCIALTGSRGAVIALCMQLSIAAGLFLHLRGKSWNTWKTPLLSIIGVCMGAVLTVVVMNQIRSVSFPVTDVQGRLIFSGKQGSAPVTERWHYWKAALTLATDRPLTGWGPDSFGSTHQRFQAQAMEHTSHPHSMFLKLAAERGWVALILFCAMMIWILHAGFCRTHSSHKMVLPSIALAGVLFHNFVDTTLMMPGVSIPFWILAGSIVRMPVQRQHHSLLSIGVVAILALVMTTAEWRRPTLLRGMTDLQEAAGLLAEGKTDEAGVMMQAFHRMSPEEPQGAFMLGQFFVQKNDLQEAIKWHKESYEKWGWNSPVSVSTYLETLASAGELDAVATLEPRVRAQAISFVEAVEVSRHGAAEGSVAGEIHTLIDTLTLVYPSRRDEWEQLRTRVTAAQEKWHVYFRDKPKGKLW